MNSAILHCDNITGYNAGRFANMSVSSAITAHLYTRGASPQQTLPLLYPFFLGAILLNTLSLCVIALNVRRGRQKAD